MNFPKKHESVFDREHDVIIVGGGLVGLAAAERFSGRGLSVLLVESGGSLLWEASEALEDRAEGAHDGPWSRWLAALGPEASGGGYYHPALAEMHTARRLAAADRPFGVLLYAVPCAAEVRRGLIAGVEVATKAGRRMLRGRLWVDASEGGLLACLAGAKLSGRAPAARYRRLLVQSVDCDRLDAVLREMAKESGDFVRSVSARPGERVLRWMAGEVPWHRRVESLVAEMRARLGDSNPEGTVVSHCAMRDYPEYDAGVPQPGGPVIAENLRVLSPALVARRFSTPGDRFDFGFQFADGAVQPPLISGDGAAGRAADVPSEHDVLVAGAGTAGALAAIAAARAGARTLAIDAMRFPGGVGTGGGVNGYFYGAEGGGLQAELNGLSAGFTRLLAGRPVIGENGWHHDAKKLALLRLFDEAGVRFLGGVSIIGAEVGEAGRMKAVLIARDGRPERARAKAFVDSTGDGDLCVAAGCDFWRGREFDGRTLAYSQSVFRLERSGDKLEVKACNFDAGWVDAESSEDVTRARLEGVAQHLGIGGRESDAPLAVAPVIGLRHSRNIRTDRVLSLDDMVEHRVFADAIGETSTVADTHSVDFEFESDEMAFHYLVCKGFWEPLHCQIPYGMLLPKGLDNVWIACRAAGIRVEATYGMRMQRDMQRLGEVAGLAAARAARHRAGSREVDIADLRRDLHLPRREEPLPAGDAERARWLEELDRGNPGMHLRSLVRDEEAAGSVAARLGAASERTSFYAAAVLAMRSDTRAEARLLRALENRETGPDPEEHAVRGAWGQCIDYPFWLIAALMLRRCGTERCLPALLGVIVGRDQPFNVLTVVACTLERLSARLGPSPSLEEALGRLVAAADAVESVLPPSRSLWNELHGRPQTRLYNDRGADTRQDHAWQLHLVVARALRGIGKPPHSQARAFRDDPRGFVRNAFAPLFDADPPSGFASAVRESSHDLIPSP